jgi:hypothetical protein
MAVTETLKEQFRRDREFERISPQMENANAIFN